MEEWVATYLLNAYNSSPVEEGIVFLGYFWGKGV
jgi:hypothetical protein